MTSLKYKFQISYAKRKKEGADQVSSHLHFIKCEELANCCLGFNGWSSSIKMVSIIYMKFDQLK